MKKCIGLVLVLCLAIPALALGGTKRRFILLDLELRKKPEIIANTTERCVVFEDKQPGEEETEVPLPKDTKNKSVVASAGGLIIDFVRAIIGGSLRVFVYESYEDLSKDN